MGAASQRDWPLPRVHRSAVHALHLGTEMRGCIGVGEAVGRCMPRDISACVPRLRATVAFRVQSIPLAHGNRRCRTVRPPDRLNRTPSMVVQSRWKVRHESEYAHPACADSPGTADVASCGCMCMPCPSVPRRGGAKGHQPAIAQPGVLPQGPLGLNGLAEQLCDLFGPSWGEVNVVELASGGSDCTHAAMLP